MIEISDVRENMEKTLKALDHEFLTLRTGRPTPALLDDVTVDYYGVPTPVSQVGNIKVPEGHLMTIEPWEKSMANAIEKAILAANLGVTPNNDGSGVIRLPFPAPTEERRKEIVKECHGVAEKSRVGIRNVRRDAKGKAERAQKDSEISEDELKRFEDQLQKLTDEFIGKIDEKLSAKEAEVMEI